VARNLDRVSISPVTFVAIACHSGRLVRPVIRAINFLWENILKNFCCSLVSVCNYSNSLFFIALLASRGRMHAPAGTCKQSLYSSIFYSKKYALIPYLDTISQAGKWACERTHPAWLYLILYRNNFEKRFKNDEFSGLWWFFIY